MAPVGLPAIAWMPPYVAHVPIATTPQARGASRSIHQFRVSGSPVRSSLPNEVQYPSPLMFSFGIDPSITRTNGASSPRAAARNGARYSSPPSVGESTLLYRWTVGRPGTRPVTTSSIAGWDAAVTDTVSPSQLNPSEIQRMCTSSTPWGRPFVDPVVSTVIGSPSVVARLSPRAQFSTAATPTSAATTSAATTSETNRTAASTAAATGSERPIRSATSAGA